MPPMSNQNSLQLMDLTSYEELHLTELENSMIALNIIFQKVFNLPKSRWPGMKDKTVNIPIFETDVLKTIESLPRTPSDAGIIPVNFKRKLMYKNSHMTQYISVPKIMKALNTLKELGNKYYQFVPQNVNFEDECREHDLEGFRFIYPEDEITCEDSNVKEQINELESDDEESEKEENEYQKHDSVKKWQFEYNKSTCFSNNYPEISYKEDHGDKISVAPGEGKTPSNILQENDWDLKSFPCLLPDGENSLHSKREIKLSEQDYFTQRILNKDDRFATSPAYVFAAVAYVEKKQIEGRKGISFQRGKASTSDGITTYSLENPFSVLDNVKNTPRYWQKTRYELLARMENLGPFQYFFTLSCADMRWPENFTALLRDQTITYVENNFIEEVYVNGKKLMDYLIQNQSKHSFIKKNLLNATLTFHNRVKMFVKHIIMSKSNPMCIKNYSYKVEFALRGAGHIHGVLWVDWENFKSTNTQLIKDAFIKIKNEEILSKEDKKCIAEFADLSIQCTLKDPKTKEIVEEVQMHHHTHSCRKYCEKCRFYYPRFPCLRTIVAVPFNKYKDKENLEKQADRMTKAKETLKKVSNVLEDDEMMAKLQEIGVEGINDYIHLQQTINFLENLIRKDFENKAKVVTITEIVRNQVKKCTTYEDVTLTSTLLDFETMLVELKSALIIKKEEIKKIEELRLSALLDKAGVIAEENKSLIKTYEKALSVSQTGYKIVHKRDINEIYVNNYNPEWIISWNANMDLQLCLDYYAIITYICDYYSKDDSGTMKHIKEALKKAGNDSLQAKLSLVVHQFLTHRQIGESEAFFKILPHLHMKSSNIETVFVPTGFKSNRSGFLKQLTENEAKSCKNVVKVLNKDGLFAAKPSLMDKFERKDTSKNNHIKDLPYTQFCMKYVSSSKEPKENNLKSIIFCRGDKGFENSEEMDLIVTHDFIVSDHRYSLPNVIQLKDPQPGEPKFMRKRSRQVVRFHKFNRTKNPHEYHFAQLQMFFPFKQEEDLQPDDFEKCKLIFNQRSSHNDNLKIQNVKSVLLEYLESVEDGIERAEEIMDSNIGDKIDPALEQDNEDCADIGLTEHPDFLFKDPTDLLVTREEVKRFKAIDLNDDQTLDVMSRALDVDQRVVLEIGVNFAKSVVKFKKVKKIPSQPPLLIVQGGAGTGKSTVIDVLSQQMEKVLRKPGDNPDHPYIIKAAFTGTAAANIKGQTLHSAFSFSFGNNFFSPGDKSRDERRNQLENLLVVIIDEFSMMKADMLYQLDLRLREVKQQPDLLFGGVSVFLFGDILQLKPVLGRYIFDEPINESFLLAFLTSSLWKKFCVIILRHNHRQGEDRNYADILNRLRIANVTEEDVKTLESRVRPLNHPDIPRNALVVTCKNSEVNQINEERLKDIEDKEIIIESINKASSLKQFKPRTDAGGNIAGTPLQRQLKLKTGAKVMLTYNINTFDCLTNGALGEVLGFKFNQDGSVKEVYVHFFNEDCGKERRKIFVTIQEKYPGKFVTPIELIEFQYSISKKGNNSNSNATSIQFPLKLAFAATAHKVQGQTVKKPNHLVIDLRSVREAAQAYVILSRVQALSQLFILVSVCADKITASYKAIEELERMNKVSKEENKYTEQTFISCNIRSIKKNFENFVSASAIKQAQVICLQETWLDPLVTHTNLLEKVGWNQHNNSVGKGKGISTFYKEDFVWEKDVKQANYQMTKICSENIDIINVYRSSGAENIKFLKDLCSLVSSGKQSLIQGDFNICYISEKSHQVFQMLKSQGFQQLVNHPTHIEGRLIDLVFFFSPDPNAYYEVQQQAQWFTDHDLIQVVRGKSNNSAMIFFIYVAITGSHHQEDQ